MKLLVIPFFMLLTGFPAAAEEFQLGNDVNKLIRMQTIDPLAENRVPTGSPTFSGKKASKSLSTAEKGEKSEKVKTKNIIASSL